MSLHVQVLGQLHKTLILEVEVVRSSKHTLRPGKCSDTLDLVVNELFAFMLRDAQRR